MHHADAELRSRLNQQLLFLLLLINVAEVSENDSLLCLVDFDPFCRFLFFMVH